MYNNKEKAKLLRELGHPSHAQKDIALLEQLSPNHDLITSARISPARYAEQILYALLDLTTAEKIRINRREEKKPVTPPNTQKNGSKTGKNNSAKAAAKSKPAATKPTGTPVKKNTDKGKPVSTPGGNTVTDKPEAAPLEEKKT